MVLLSALVACSDYTEQKVTVVDQFDQAASNEVDILWVIDNSTSMAEEQGAVSAAADDFLGVLTGANLDFHLGVITTDLDGDNPYAGVLLGSPNVLDGSCLDDGDGSDCTYARAFSLLVQQGTSGSDQEKGLGAVIAAITDPLVSTSNVGFLRDGAPLTVIILSDENDCSDDGALPANATGDDCYAHSEALTSVLDLVARTQKAKQGTGGVTLNGIIGPPLEEGCETATEGRRYSSAIEATGGLEANICQSDYSATMADLGLYASGVLDTFQLTNAAIEDSIEVTVWDPDTELTSTVDPDATNGWSYVSEYAQVKFNGTSVPVRGARIEVSYEPSGPVPNSDTGS